MNNRAQQLKASQERRQRAMLALHARQEEERQRRRAQRTRALVLAQRVLVAAIVLYGFFALATPRLLGQDYAGASPAIIVTPPEGLDLSYTKMQVSITMQEFRNGLQELGLQQRTPELAIKITLGTTKDYPLVGFEDADWRVTLTDGFTQYRYLQLPYSSFGDTLDDASIDLDNLSATSDWIDAHEGATTLEHHLTRVETNEVTYFTLLLQVRMNAPVVSASMVDGEWVQGWSLLWDPADTLTPYEGEIHASICKGCDIAAIYGDATEDRPSFEWTGPVDEELAIDIDTPWRPFNATEKAFWWIAATVLAALVSLPVTYLLTKRSTTQRE